MDDFAKNCRGVPIITHLRAISTHPQYRLLVGSKMLAQAKLTIDETQSNDIYKSIVTLQLLEKLLDELYS